MRYIEQMSKNPFEQVREFHEHFDPNTHSEVKALDKKIAEYRSGFKLEEIIEFLYAANNGDEKKFYRKNSKKTATNFVVINYFHKFKLIKKL